jgi:SAM-dependent methyltransferase
MPLDSPRFCAIANAFFSFGPVPWLLRSPQLGIRSDPESYAQWELKHAPSAMSLFGKHGDLVDKDVLDVGCAFGGKSVCCALKGARSVTGIDVDADRIKAASTFAGRYRLSNLFFEIRDFCSCGFPAASFDKVLLLDTLEHLSDPLAALREAHRLLREGGTALISFPPYRSAWGAHLVPFVRIPWAPFLFSEAVLLRLWRRRFDEAGGQRNLFSDGKSEELRRVGRLLDILGLNGMTIAWFESILTQLPFTISYRSLHCLWSSPLVAGVKWLREYFVSRYLVVLTK